MCKKKGFRTRDEAVLFIIAIRSWGKQAPYKCNKCEWFHNTSSPSTVNSFLYGKGGRKVRKYMAFMSGDASPFSDPDDYRACVVAGFTSPCSWGDVIYEGDTIRSDGEGGWEHIECSKAEAAVVNDDSMDDPEFGDSTPEWSL